VTEKLVGPVNEMNDHGDHSRAQRVKTSQAPGCLALKARS
jgi:hypothetical protein